MLNAIKSLLKPSAASAPPPAQPQGRSIQPVPGTTIPVLGEAVPRYPEKPKAIPAIGTEELLGTQAELIEKIRASLGHRASEFDELVMPVLHRHAAYTHLLPASEYHHHCGIGGLLRHSLEVAHFCAIQTNGYRFGADIDAETARDLRPRWIVAAVYAGLLHDITKPIVDLGAIDVDGKHTWNPHTGPLTTWFRRHGLDRYYLFWQPGDRAGRHDGSPLGLALAREIIGPDLFEFLGAKNDIVIRTLFQALFEPDESARSRNPLYRIWKHADSESVRLDLQRMRNDVNANSASGLQRRLATRFLALIQEVVKSDAKAPANHPGALAYQTTQGTFGLMPQLLERVADRITREKIEGLPTSTYKILDYLEEAGFIDIMDDGENTFRTWKVTLTFPAHRDARMQLTLLKFPQPHFLFGGIQPPQPIEAQIQLHEAAGPGEQSPTTDATAPTPAANSAGPVAATAVASPAAPSAPAAPSSPASAADAAPASAAAQTSTVPPPKAAPPTEPPAIVDRRKLLARGGGDSMTDMLLMQIPGDEAQSMAFLREHGLAGEHLLGLALNVRKGLGPAWGKDVIEQPDGTLRLVVPNAFSAAGSPPQKVLEELVRAQLLKKDESGTVVQEITEGDHVTPVVDLCLAAASAVAQVARGSLAPEGAAEAANEVVGRIAHSLATKPPGTPAAEPPAKPPVTGVVLNLDGSNPAIIKAPAIAAAPAQGTPPIPHEGGPVFPEFERWAKRTFYEHITKAYRDPSSLTKDQIAAEVFHVAKEHGVPFDQLTRALVIKGIASVLVVLQGDPDKHMNQIRKARSAFINTKFRVKSLEDA